MKEGKVTAYQVLRSLANELGYKLEKKKPATISSDIDISDYSDDIDDLKREMRKIDTEIATELEISNKIKQDLINYWNKKGPDEFTAHIFEGNTAVPNRVLVVNETEGYLRAIQSKLKEKLKNKLNITLIASLSDKDRIKSIEPIEMSVGKGLKITIIKPKEK